MKVPLGLKKIPDWVFYALLPLIAYAPAFLRGECFFDNDLLGWFGPHWDYLRASLAKGDFPLWNPSLFGGQPFAADPQTLVFYPFLYPFLFFPVGWGLLLFLAFHLFVAALGMDRWLDSLGIPAPARRIGACLFALSGFFWIELIHPPVVAAVAWLPWVFASLERAAREPTVPNAFRSGLSFALLFLAGSLQVAVGSFYAASLYAVARRVFWSRKSRKPLLPSGGFWAALLWGLLPLMAAALPAGEFSMHSTRLRSTGDYASFNARGSLHPQGLIRFIAPTHGLPSGTRLGTAVQSLDSRGDNPYQGALGSLGPLALFLALWGLTEGGLGALLGSLAMGAVAVGLGRHLPLHRWLCEFLPFMGWIKVPARYLFLYALPMAALVAFGLQRLERWGTLRRPAGSKAISPLGWAVVGLCVCGPLLPMGWNFYPTGPARNYDFASNAIFLEHAHPSPPPARNFLTGTLPYRVWQDRAPFVTDFPVNAAGSLGWRSCTGYNPLMLESYRLLQSLPPERFCETLGADQILSGRDLGPLDGFQREISGPLFIYKTKKPSRPVRALSPGDSSDAASPETFQDDLAALSGFWLLFNGCDRQNYRLVMTRSARVVFPDLYFPGWRVDVDGKRSDCLNHGGHRAVFLDRGSHEVVFHFKPFWWPWIPLALAFWLVLTLRAARAFEIHPRLPGQPGRRLP